MNLITDIKAQVVLFNKKCDENIAAISSYEKMIEDNTDKQRAKMLRGDIVTSRMDLNKYIYQYHNDICNKIITALFDLERYKQHGVLPNILHDDVKWCYLILSDFTRSTARYVKLPKSWIPLGFLAGVLEDLVVIMRTGKQLNISPNHLISLEELIGGYDIYNKKVTDRDVARFPFLTKLFTLPRDDIMFLLKNAVDSQGKARRISVYFDKNDNKTYYYAIQGLLRGVKFDSRVVKTLTSDDTPPFAVHFTTKDVALNIWNKAATTAKRDRPGDAPLQVGAICKFDRPIHALTNIELIDGYYSIVTSDKDIKDRMTHGIKDVNVRCKYESGLVIDLKKLVADIPYGKVQMNEIGTLLVHDDIPHQYLLRCLITEDDLNHFWHI